MAAWASSRKPALPSTTAMPASPTIYEGTTAIQANDLVGRKIARERRPRRVKAVIAEIRKVGPAWLRPSGDDFAAMRKSPVGAA